MTAAIVNTRETIDSEKLTIRPDDRMHRRQVLPLIQRRPSLPPPKRIPQSPRLIVEKRRIMRRRQPLQKPRHLRRQPIINLIPRRPERIAPRLREHMDLEHGVVGGYALEADIRMPADGSETTGVAELVRKTAAFLLLLAADYADLVAEFAAFFGEGVDVES